MKHLKYSVLLTLATICLALPLTNNPISSFYKGNEGYPAWTDNIKWSNVIDMSAYSTGANAFAKFENARDQLFAQGGGVLYYPRGTYDFSDMPAEGPTGRGLMLKNGVVIRGEVPTTDSLASDGTLPLPTVFLFPFQTKGGGQVPKDWNIIGLKPSTGQRIKDVSNVGLVWINVVGGIVYFGPDIRWGATMGTAKSWKTSLVKQAWKSRIPDGTFPLDPFCSGDTMYMGSASGRIVFGCRLDDAAFINDVVDEGAGPTGFYMDKFVARINVYGNKVLVANNLLPKSTKSFAYHQTACKLANSSNPNSINCGVMACERVADTLLLYDYGKVFGIDVNKDLLGFVNDKSGLFSQGVILRDNWVYNHGTKGYNISGKWVTIRNCRNERAYLQSGDAEYGSATIGWVLTLDGYHQSLPGGPGCVSDNLSRAFDLAGQNLWIDSCYFNNTGSDPGNDGEGILCQSWGGTQIYSWAITRNTHVRGTGEASYIGGYDVQQYGSLMAWNTTSGWVGSVSAGANVDAAYVSNNATGGTSTTGTDVITTCPSGSPAKPTGLSVTVVENDHIRIIWQDNANNEIGFRIDRKIENGPWYIIAFRPRKSSGSTWNEMAWEDFTAPRGKALTYRVVAINCDNSDVGASDPTNSITISAIATSSLHPGHSTLQSQSCHLSIKDNQIIMNGLDPASKNISLSLYDFSGRLLFTKISFVNLSGQSVLKISRLSKGWYCVGIKGDKSVLVMQLVVIAE